MTPDACDQDKAFKRKLFSIFCMTVTTKRLQFWGMRPRGRNQLWEFAVTLHGNVYMWEKKNRGKKQGKSYKFPMNKNKSKISRMTSQNDMMTFLKELCNYKWGSSSAGWKLLVTDFCKAKKPDWFIDIHVVPQPFNTTTTIIILHWQWRLSSNKDRGKSWKVLA